MTLGQGGLGSMAGAVLAAARARWSALSLERQFLITSALAVVLSMASLGDWVENRIRAGWMQGMAETGALYLEGFLAPHVQELASLGALPEERHDEIKALLVNTNLGSRVAIIKIWDLSGTLIFSTNGSASREKLHPDYIARIKAGHVVVDDVEDDHVAERRSDNVRPELLEIYAPIYKAKTKEIIGIGEFYEYSHVLKREIANVRYSTWFLIANVAILIIVLLQVIVKRASRTISTQQALLEANLARAGAMAKRNNALRRVADRARLNAAVLNETYLASIGADIHDGPIQVLSLMMLKLPAGPRPDGKQPPGSDIRSELEPLIQQVLADLRNLSTGLVLPEVDDLSITETLQLAITRHEQQTGTLVARDIATLPEHVPVAIRVCAFRIVQEALTNAYKHAQGRGQRVSARFEADMLEILVSDSGAAPPAHLRTEAAGAQLGLRGMESRVRALRGTLTVTRMLDGGTEVLVALPVRP
jgi:signal transduction histidine kinase